MERNGLETKAQLLAVGTVQLARPPQEDRYPQQAGSGRPVGLFPVRPEDGAPLCRLKLAPAPGEPPGGVAILRDNIEIACGQLVTSLALPEQAYITVSERCIYDCKFCAVPKLGGGVKSRQP